MDRIAGGREGSSHPAGGMRKAAAEPPAPSAVAAVDARGRHRISAEWKRVEQEAQLLEEELEELGKIEKVSASFQELLYTLENRPDPLLPVTHGPANPSWDQWFEGPQDKQGCRCSIL